MARKAKPPKNKGSSDQPEVVEVSEIIDAGPEGLTESDNDAPVVIEGELTDLDSDAAESALLHETTLPPDESVEANSDAVLKDVEPGDTEGALDEPVEIETSQQADASTESPPSEPVASSPPVTRGFAYWGVVYRIGLWWIDRRRPWVSGQ